MSALPEPSTRRPEDVQATFCATLVDEWVRAGVTDAVVSPGSRSTPMALAIAADTRLRLQVVLDERSASFRALGLAKVTARPVVLLCTSGTAAVEYHAAVAEADLDRVPLLVCTADRPAELHGIGAPQTVDQQFLFGRSVRWFGQIGVPDPASEGAWRSFASRAFCEATSGSRGPGPVHLNLPFREPLVGVPGPLPAARADDAPWHAVTTDAGALIRLASGRRGIIVVGAGATPSGDDGTVAAITSMATALGWPVLSEPRSGVRDSSDALICAVDQILRSATAAEVLRPEVIIRFGAPWASKVFGQWLASCVGAVDVLVDPHDAWLDPHRTANVVIHSSGRHVSARFVASPSLDGTFMQPADPAWLQLWEAASRAADGVLASALDSVDDAPMTEPWIARAVVRDVPSASRIVVSSSMPVRDVEWFTAPRPDVAIVANRGANGIDGVVSTILGAATADAGPTFGLLGDLSFLHDAGALASAGKGEVNATLIVIDNGGGGIFEFLPQASTLERDRFELLFGTEQPVDVAAVLRGYGVAVEEPTTKAEFVAVVRSAPQGLRAVLVKTDRQANVAHHNELQQRVVNAVEAAIAAIS